MRIFTKKRYIVWPKVYVSGIYADGRPGNGPEIVDGQQLRDKIRLGTMREGDTIYETDEFATVKEKRSVELVGPAGDVVDTNETTEGLAASNSGSETG